MGIKIDRNKLLEMYRVMVLTRVFEARFMEWFSEGRVREEPYVGIGQEAVGVGTCSALREDDIVLPSLRGRAQFLSRGVSVKRLVATFCGRTTGFSGGRMTSDHVAAPEQNIIGGVGIVGAGIPVAVGAALASCLMGDDRVTMVFFGDGASNTGAFHEGLNFAGARDAPVVFVCENNQYAISTSITVATAAASLASRAPGYGFPGETVDGNDVLEVFRASRDAVDRARRGDGPSLIECVTYRINSHCPSLPDLRDPDEISVWKERCPIRRFEERLLSDGILTPQHIEKTACEAEDEVARALAWAEASPWPLPEDAARHVYWGERRTGERT